MREATRAVADPRSGRSLHEVWRKQQGSREPVSAGADTNLPLGWLGSGSDYTPFFHHAGVAALDVGFSGDYGVYHSRYDSFQWMRRYGDPDFAYHAALARLAASEPPAAPVPVPVGADAARR